LKEVEGLRLEQFAMDMPLLRSCTRMIVPEGNDWWTVSLQTCRSYGAWVSLDCGSTNMALLRSCWVSLTLRDALSSPTPLQV